MFIAELTKHLKPSQPCSEKDIAALQQLYYCYGLLNREIFTRILEYLNTIQGLSALGQENATLFPILKNIIQNGDISSGVRHLQSGELWVIYRALEDLLARQEFQEPQFPATS